MFYFDRPRGCGKLPEFYMQFINDIIGDELKVFEKRFAEAVRSETHLLDTIMKYIIKRKGKQLRPHVRAAER